MIKHTPIFDTDKVVKLYSEKDGVPIKYVCTTAINGGSIAVDVFYRETPHPEFGNRYFGLYKIYRQHLESSEQSIFICNADRVESFEFGLIKDDEDNLQYSSHVHDYKSFRNGHMIDGGRAYVRSGVHPVYTYIVRNGEMMEKKDE